MFLFSISRYTSPILFPASYPDLSTVTTTTVTIPPHHHPHTPFQPPPKALPPHLHPHPHALTIHPVLCPAEYPNKVHHNFWSPPETIIGAVVGSVLGLFMIIGGLLFLWYKRRKKSMLRQPLPFVGCELFLSHPSQTRFMSSHVSPR